MKRLLSLILAFILTLSLVTPVSAALISPDQFLSSTTVTVHDYLSGNDLTLPSGWEYELDDESNDTMTKVHIFPKDSSIIIKYQDVDYWSLMREEYRENCPRSEIDNDAISKKIVAELVGVDQDDISMVLVDGIEYFYIVRSSSTISYGYQFTTTNIFLIRFHDGYFYTYLFGADENHSLYDEFIDIVASATYGTAPGSIGGTYSGQTKNDLPHGTGTLTFAGGSFSGRFENGYPKGSGVFTFSNGKSIEGEDWDYGITEVDTMLAVYEGMLLDGEPAGYGTLYFEYGAQYNGTFRNEFPYGQGTYTASNKKTTSGTWKWVEYEYDSWVPERQGADMYYSGMCCDGIFYGYGVLAFVSGGAFFGEFEKGNVNGWGIYAYHSPSSENTKYMEGTSWSTVFGEYRLEHTYYGLKLDGKWQGFGIGIKRSGYAYCGEILNDYRDGHGELYTPQDKLEEWGIYRHGKISQKYTLP